MKTIDAAVYCGVYGVCEQCKHGEHYDAAGIVEFFMRMAVGAVVVGALFGALLVVCIAASKSDGVMQIAFTIAAAYGSYFVAEHDAGMSGVLACVACSGVFAAFGWPSIKDHAVRRGAS